MDGIFNRNADARIVVCGDFNAKPGEVPVEAIRGRVENTNNAELGERVLVPCSDTIPESLRFTLYHQGQGSLLDHMLISKSMLPFFRGAYIYNENLHDESLREADDRMFPESDHAPFVAEFAL